MAAQRRMGAPDAKNRTVLLDAAEQLLLREGYGAVTSRRVAAEAGLKSQLVHYYFATMDELYIEMFRRRAEAGLAHQQQLLAGERPLHALWEFNNESAGMAFTSEYTSLANRSPAVRQEMMRYSERFRTAQLEVVTVVFERYRIPPEVTTPMAFVVGLTAIARMLLMEERLGFTQGHEEMFASMKRILDQLEPEDQARKPRTRRKS